MVTGLPKYRWINYYKNDPKKSSRLIYFKKLSLYDVYFWQVKVLHDVLMFLKFLKFLLHK